MKTTTKSLARPQSKRGKYSARLSNTLALGNHESFRTDDNFYRMLVESLVGYGIFTTDKEGGISSWNTGAEKLFGYSEKEIIGKNASIMLRPKDADMAQLQKELKTAAKKGKFTDERYHVCKDGSHFWASGLIFSLGDQKDVARGFTFIVRDLTEKTEFEKRKDAFISTATHELRTPITSMKLYAQIAEQEIIKTKNDVSIQSISKLNKQLDKLMNLMDYLLDIAKLQKEKLELKKTIFDLNMLIADTLTPIMSVSPNHLIYQDGVIKEKIFGDRERIGQVLTNLLTNAIKYSPNANKIAVTCKLVGRNVVISVRDHGLGIPKSEQSAIFGRFYRATTAIDNKIEGIGLGLYVAQQIVLAHKGKMWLESEVNKGSTFYFSIPRKAND